MEVSKLVMARWILLMALVEANISCTQHREYILAGPQPWLPSGEQATGMLVTTRQTVVAKTYTTENIYWSDSDNQTRAAVDQVCDEIKAYLELIGQWTPPQVHDVVGRNLSPITPQESKLKALWREVNEQSLALKGEGRESIVSHRYGVCRIIVGIDPVVVVESDAATDSVPGPVRTLRARPVEKSIVVMSHGLDFGHRMPIGTRIRWFSPTLGVAGESITLDSTGRGRIHAGPHVLDVSNDEGWLTIVPYSSPHE